MLRKLCVVASAVVLWGCCSPPAPPPCPQPAPVPPGAPWPTTVTARGMRCAPSLQTYRLPAGDEAAALGWPDGWVAVHSEPGATRRGYGRTEEEAASNAGWRTAR